MTKGWKSESVRHSLARKGVKTGQKTTVKKIGVVGVDSGTLMLTDPAYAMNKGWSKKDYDKYVVGMGKKTKEVPFKLGHKGRAVIFESGFGDGVYSVFAKIKDFGKMGGKRIVEVKVKME